MPEFEEMTSPSYKLETVNSANSRMVNCFCETIEKGPRAGKLRFRGIPGLRPFTTLPDGPGRAMLDSDSGNRLFCVSGSTVYEVFSDGTFQAQIGNIALNSHPVTMCTNGFQLAIASGGLGYILNGGMPAGTVSQIFFTDHTPLRAQTIDFQDQYFIASQVDSKQIYVSNLAPDGAIWDPGDTAIKEAYPDNISRVFCDNEQLWLFGFDTLEVWQNTGAAFPFQRIQGAVLKIGNDAPYSVAGARGYRFWLWKGGIYMAYGIDPQRVSDYGVEEAIKTYGNVSDAEGFCYISAGHLFYVISFPSVQKTWVFDAPPANSPFGSAPLRAWHEREFWKNGASTRYRPRAFARAFGKDLVIDSQSGQIWQLDPNYHWDADGLPLRRHRTAPYVTHENKNLRFNQLTLDCDTGVGLDVAPGQPGYDPKVIMRYSDDRGKTFGNEIEESLGKIGSTKERVIWNQLGSSRIGKTFELTVTDPVPFVVNSAYLKVGAPEQGR